MPTPLTRLLARMGNGDRNAVAELLGMYEPRLRRRIRGKMRHGMQRLFDSEEIFATLSRRLDLYVSQRRLDPCAEGQFWAFLFQLMDRAVIEKGRLFHRLQSLHGSDSSFAREMLKRLHEAEQQRPNGAELEVERALALLPSPADRQIVLLWLDGFDFPEIADELDLSQTSTRKRWERIRTQLRRKFEDGEL